MKKILRIILFITILAAIVVFVIFLICLPFNADIFYKLESTKNVYSTGISKGDLLDYYAQLLSFIATIILGVIAVYQTYKSQKKSAEINELQISIMQRELAIAEKQYKNEENTSNLTIPKFEIRISGYSGWYNNIDLKIKNVSEFIISDFKIISFEIHTAEKIEPIKDWKVPFQSISSAEIQTIVIKTPNLVNKVSYRQQEPLKDVKFVLKFSCEDSKYNKHFFSAILDIPKSDVFESKFWKVEKIG